MKKTILAAVAALGLACGAHAAMVYWSVEGTLTDWNGSAITGASGLTAYLYALEGADSAITYSADDKAFSFGSAQLVESSSAFDDGWANWDGTDSSATNLGHDPQYFQVILSDASSLSSLSEGDHIYLYGIRAADSVDYSANPATPTLIEGFQFYEGTGTVGTWTTVPEPCSVALLLLGAAAFGLKRKRA